jgi:hypothetical protein
MNDNSKSECIESIVRAMERSSVWRKSLALRYPDDPRNLRAAETLETLAAEAAAMTEEQWNTLSSQYNWASERWRSALNDTTKGIGFHIRTKQFSVFINALLQRLSLTTSDAA